MIFFQVGNRVTSVTQVMTDIQTHSDTRIQVFRMFPYICCIRICFNIGPMQMDRIVEVILFHFLIHIRKQFVIGYAHNQLHPYAFRILETTVNFRFTLHIYRTNSIAGNIMSSTFLMKCLDLFFVTIQRQMEILNAKIMNIESLQCLQSSIQIKINKCITSHPQTPGVY